MSASGFQGVDGASSTRSLEGLMRECEALSRAIERARARRRIVLVALLLFVVGVSIPYFLLYRRVTDPANVDQLIKAVQERLAGRSETYMREVQLFVDSTSPVITEAFYKRSVQDLPLFLQGVEKERGEFVESLQDRMSKALTDHYDAILAKHEAILIREVPEAQDEVVRKRLVANMHVVFERLVQKYYADELKLKLTALYDGWDNFPPAEKPKGGEPELEQQFLGTLLEAVSHRLAESSPSAASKP